jgi:hypothetical protein
MGITVGFSTTNKLISRFIRWVTRGKVSHAWISFYDETLDQRFVMQAEAWGYEVRPWTRWRQENTWVAEYILPQTPEVRQALQRVSEYLGADYDYAAAILSGIWSWLKRWFGLWIKKPLSDPSKLMCSEGVVVFLGFARLGYDDLNPETTAPQVLLDRVSADTRFQALPSPL